MLNRDYIVQRFKRLAASGWTIASISFAVTALVLQSPGLPLA